jgi:hypothetical protein
MALIRDPNFWRRFSRAVHLADEEKEIRSAESIEFAATSR